MQNVYDIYQKIKSFNKTVWSIKEGSFIFGVDIIHECVCDFLKMTIINILYYFWYNKIWFILRSKKLPPRRIMNGGHFSTLNNGPGHYSMGFIIRLYTGCGLKFLVLNFKIPTPYFLSFHDHPSSVATVRAEPWNNDPSGELSI